MLIRKKQSFVALYVFALFANSAFGQQSCSPNCRTPLSVATWNTNLTPGSTQFPTERTYEAVQSMPDSDLICLQEVYTQFDQDSFSARLNKTYPYTYSAPFASQNCSHSCTSENIATLNTCSVNCGNMTSMETTNCMYQHCGSELGALPSECQMCLGIMGENWSSTVAGCTTDGAANTQGCNYLYGGSSGIMIFSKYAFTASRYIIFNNTAGVASGALHVRIEFNGTPINFFCTSLSPSSTPYPTGTDMSEINQMQTMELLDWIETGVHNNEPIIVAGSFNQGPANNSTSNSGVDVENYSLWTTASYESALIITNSAGQAPCTMCSHNATGVTVDHIFFKNTTTPAPCIKSASIFASGTTVSTSTGSVPISSHSGVSASVCYGTESAPSVSPSVQPTTAPSIIPPTNAPISSPVVVPVASTQPQASSEAGIAMPAVVLAAALVGVAMILNR